jgi:hypothetical protein
MEVDFPVPISQPEPCMVPHVRTYRRRRAVAGAGAQRTSLLDRHLIPADYLETNTSASPGNVFRQNISGSGAGLISGLYVP